MAARLPTVMETMERTTRTWARYALLSPVMAIMRIRMAMAATFEAVAI